MKILFFHGVGINVKLGSLPGTKLILYYQAVDNQLELVVIGTVLLL